MLLAALSLGGCGSWPLQPLAVGETPIATRIERLLPADALLLGEQHDAADHQRIQAEVVTLMAARSGLAALAIEMAEAGNGTAHLPPTATDEQARTALSWNDQAWAWANYGPVVMAAVRAGVPVLGANLPRERMKDAMDDVSLDVQLGEAAMIEQREAIRSGHCGLLPESQIAPMTRIQIARDRSMAHAIATARVPGKTVVLVAGAGHVSSRLGVPQQLPDDLKVVTVRLAAGAASNTSGREPGFDALWATPAVPVRDHCADFRLQQRQQQQQQQQRD
ncbi:MAG: hypothetical protein EOO22_09545 [Comamonadaceae bacterium]|nr:MAG: hypothetical protein EOO22_09545 [Comamonadaceae bacterium]